jgi:phosphotransferase system  glucose/maltose/N-acetylglucosamine-specific IIC component
MPIYSYTPPGNPNGQAIASLVLGIVSIVCLPTSYFGGAYIGAITGILGIVFAAVGMNKVNGRGLAIAGLVLSIIGTIISLCIVAILLSLFAAAIKASH